MASDYQEGVAADILGDIPALFAAAHELKTPLGLIRQLALELEEFHDTETAMRIRLTAERSLRLVDGLTRSLRLEDAMFACEPVELRALCYEVADEIQPMAKALHQRVDVNLPKRAITVLGNTTLLRTTLMGLCDNALLHNDERFPVIIGAMERSGRAIASVQDHGPKTKSLLVVQRRLGRALQPLSGRPQSSGLGLYLAHTFARHMQAELTLIRHREAGATFNLSLPVSQQLALFGV